MTDFPKDGKPFVVESIDRETIRWVKYKPDGARQMGKPGRWQKRTWRGDFFHWENCEEPQGEYHSENEGVKLFRAPNFPKLAEECEPRAAGVLVRLWSEASSEPVPSHAGPALAVHWHLEIAGVEIAGDMMRRAWPTNRADRESLTTIALAPRHLVSLFEKLSAAVQPQE